MKENKVENQLRISVIVVTYRRPTYLKECLKSLLAQTRIPDEIVVVTRDVDSESKNVLNGIKSNSTTIKNVSVAISGIIPAENKGLESARGDIVCFIDDDARADENWVARIEENFANPSLAGVGGPVIPVSDGKPVFEKTDDVGRITWFGHVVDNFHRLVENPVEVCHLRGCNMAFRRRFLGGFDGRLVGDAYRFELDACMRVKKEGGIVYDPAVLVYHYLAPRLSDFRGEDNVKLHNNIHNNTYVLLKNLPIPNKIVFLFYAFFWGGHTYIPGVFYVLGRCIKHANPVFLRQLVPAFTGIIHGLMTYFKYATQ